jgi:hypothetical protein
MRRFWMSRLRKERNSGEKLPSLASLETRSFFLASLSTGLASTCAIALLDSAYAAKVSQSACTASSAFAACAASARATA